MQFILWKVFKKVEKKKIKAYHWVNTLVAAIDLVIVLLIT